MRRYIVWLASACLMAAVSLLAPLQMPAHASGAATPLSAESIRAIEDLVTREMSRGRIPGISLAVVTTEGVVYQQGFGVADLDRKPTAGPDTVYGAGPASQLFTALAVLKLEEQGLLSLDEPVERIVPDLRLEHQGQAASVTVRQLLHHVSGIPHQALETVAAAGENVSLQGAVRRLAGQELAVAPGTQYLYSPANYSVLGAVIELASGQPYERFMTDLLGELGLGYTYVSGEQVQVNAASGHKLNWTRPQVFAAPQPPGQVPSLGLYTTAGDLAQWLSLQLGAEGAVGAEFLELFRTMQEPNMAVEVEADGRAWAAGWRVYQSGGKLVSAGGVPGYSSYVALRPLDGLGVVVLANLDSTHTEAIGEGVLATLRGLEPVPAHADPYAHIDLIALGVVGLSALLGAALIILLSLTLLEWVRGRRSLKPGVRTWSGVLSAVLFLAALGLGLYHIPSNLLDGYSWEHVQIWYPNSLVTAVFAGYGTVALFVCYYLVLSSLPKPLETPYFLLVTLSIVSGLGYTFVTFVIAQALTISGNVSNGGLFLYFVIAILMYIYSQRIVRAKLIHLANTMVSEKRMELIMTLLRASFVKFENIESGRVYASLGHDMEVVSQSVRDFVTVVTSAASIVLCFAYLGIMSPYGLVLTVLFFLVGVGVMMVVNGMSDKVWQKVQITQNAFFKYINDLVAGFKELSMHAARRTDFEADVKQNVTHYRDQRIKVEIMFTNGFILGQLLIYCVIGSMTFAFPRIFPDIQNDTLRNYVLVLLFLIGPISSVVDLMPRAAQMKVSWKRINDLLNEARRLIQDPGDGPRVASSGEIKLELKQVTYRYKGNNGESFSVGPINCDFNAGEVVFITGGNGSGKSTLGKLITGLYEPDQGEILVNGNKVPARRLGEYFSTIFSDFYLFDKLYGHDHQAKQAEIDEYLKLLRIDDKVAVRDGALSSTKLSTGQRKRLALMLSYVDDRPVYLFDEWAADQDPEFRQYFYQTLLPQMKERGKCVIAITHDDRYFGLADRVLKMEMGRLVDAEVVSPTTESVPAV